MTLVVLLLVVALQVLLFQFGSIPFTRSFFAMHFGAATASPADAARRHVRRTARLQLVLGTLFAAGLVSVALGMPADWAIRRLVVASVSIASSAVFALTLMRNRMTLRRLAESLPDAGVRRAALETRDVSRSSRFEWIGPAAFLVTGVFVVWGVRHLQVAHDPGPGSTATRMVSFLGVQGVATALLLYFSVRLREARTTASPRFPMFRDRPDSALRLGIDLADAEVRAANLAKLGIAAWFGCVQLHLFFRATANSLTRAAYAAQWTCVGFLLLVYALYLLRVARLVRAGGKEERRPAG
jgi:hypothetical protein